MTAAADRIDVEVAYATPERQAIVPLQVAEGTSVYQAAVASGITGLFPEIDLDQQAMGVFGKVVKDPKDHHLRPGDRVEIYRPLKIDPKQARMDRAKKKPR